MDEYGNVVFVIEFKKPSVTNLDSHRPQLWKRYMKPLKADYGMLYNGLEIIFFERISGDYNRLFKAQAEQISEDHLKKIVQLLEKPDYDTTDIEKVSKYFEQFDDENERLSLVEEASREHFFQNFQLNENSEFGNLLINTIQLFEEQKGQSTFLESAYDFWKQSYAKKPENVPADWEPLMEEAGLSQDKEDLYRFMFCLETAYAVFARLILAKSGEDYGFPDVEFRDFIEDEVGRASHRGDISQSSYAKVTQELIKNMQWKLVSSVFEEDIFYWWTEPYEDKTYNELFGSKTTLEMGKFGESLAKMLLMIYKYDFSKIEGDPLGVLYQKYFDKETRKALGEFYTPQEVVDYILDSIEYDGRQILDKRLLDPACGSGTFTVTALKRYLNASEQKAQEDGWDDVLDDICNKYRLVGFDIHPFATIMAQIQFMLVLLPYYKKAVKDAKEKGDRFTLQRVPIFRTDSLVDESEGEDSKMTLKDYQDGSIISMDIKLPVTGAEEDSFFETEFEMPHTKTVRKQPQLDIHNNEEYFATLQALFDTVKQQAEDMQKKGEEQEFNQDQFIRILKLHYLSDKNFDALAEFFTPFANDLLEKIYRLQTEFDDGRLIKSIEDIFLAALLKNEQKYDFVVGNPPYVDIQTMSSEQKDYIESTYSSAEGNYDLYLPFTERGLDWLKESGRLGYITPNRFAKVNYGSELRRILSEESRIIQYVDFKDSNIFEDAVNYPAITVFENSSRKNENFFATRFHSKFDFQDEEDVLAELTQKRKNMGSSAVQNEFFDCFYFDQNNLSAEPWIIAPDHELNILDKIDTDTTLVSVSNTSKPDSALFEGLSTGAKKIFVVEEVADLGNKVRVKCEKNGETYDVEKDILKKYAEDAGKWAPSDEGFWAIFPYDEEGDPIPEETLKENFEGAYFYLESFKEDLESRRSLSKSSNWYEYSALRSRDKYGLSKIMINGFSQRSSASLDEDGVFIFGPDIYGLPLKSQYSDDEVKIVSILNSMITEFYIREIGVVHRGATYKFEDRFLKNLPLALENSDDIDLEDLNKLKLLKEKLNKFPSEYYSGTAEISTKTLSCASGHSNMDPSIQETQDGMFGVVIGKRNKEDPILVDTKEKAQFVKKSIEGDSVKKGDELELLVPRSNAEVKRILEEFEEDKQKLEEMPSVEELEEEINELVYKLYDLNEEDIEVIEDFLEKF